MSAITNRSLCAGAALLVVVASATFLHGQDDRAVFINGTQAGPATAARVAGALIGGAPGSVAPIPLGTGTIVGQAIEASSQRPVAGALVTLTLAGAAPLRVLADGQGRFAFTDLPKGSFGITVTKAGYVAGAYGRMRPQGMTQSITLVEGERVADARVRLWRFGAVTGSVVDESGEPMVGTVVAVLRKTLVSGRPRLLLSGTDATDDRGTYRLGLLEPGDYIVCVPTVSETVGSTIAEMARMLPGDPSPALIEALASSGAGAAISYATADGGSSFTFTTAASPRPAGALAGQAYPTVFYPSALTAARATLVAVTSGEERSGLDFELRPLPIARVSGTITGPSGPGANLAVSLTPSQAGDLIAPMETINARSDGAGNFSFSSVPHGDYTLRVVSGGAPMPGAPAQRVTMSMAGGQVMVERAIEVAPTLPAGRGMPLPPPPPPPPPPSRDAALWAELPVSVDRPDIPGIAVALRPGFTIAGQLEWMGSATRPAPERLAINVTLEPADARTAAKGTTGAARVNTDGTFTTRGSMPGRYVMRVNGLPAGWYFRSAMLAGRDVADQAFEIEAGDISGVSIVLADKASDLSGTVTGMEGAKDEGISVIVFPAEREAWSGYGTTARRLRSIRTDKDGSYGAQNLPPGRYYVVAVHDSAAGNWQDEAFLGSLTNLATAIEVTPGAKATQNLRVAR